MLIEKCHFMNERQKDGIKEFIFRNEELRIGQMAGMTAVL
jgi:hypothetical protein